MTQYKAPLRDIRFALHEVLDYSAHSVALSAESVEPDLLDTVLEEAAKFVENELVPLNAVGDQEGCQFADGQVSTPTGFKAAYQQYVEGGWPSLSAAPAYGGQGLPTSLATVISELLGTANWAFAMYPGLSHGALSTITAHGTEAQKQQYLPKLSSGEWTGTMCLTESHCGTDLGLLRTRAEPVAERPGEYRLTGSKIFISAGEHDLAENIVHIVLARLPNAPAGTRGISLFIVPKFLLDDSGALAQRNGVHCGSIEHKMGIHGNATCVLNFDGATGFLIGPEHRGLNCMFTFMNEARLGTALQGLAHTEWGFQHSLAYAKDRLQMRALRGAVSLDTAADPIIVHPDVRRMLLTQKAFAEAGRLFIYELAMLVDVAHDPAVEPKRQAYAEAKLALLTPVAKAFLTEVGFESANLGLQIFGGHGFIKEWGMEQNVRDCRIAMLYEGTTGIQALDLLGRKVVANQGESVRLLCAEMSEACQRWQQQPLIGAYAAELQGKIAQWRSLSQGLCLRAMSDKNTIGAASVDYLMYSGYLMLAFTWLKSGAVAAEALASDTASAEADFYRAKLATLDFYFARILPRTTALAELINADNASLMQLRAEHFSF